MYGKDKTIYLDNAATSRYMPLCVVEEYVKECENKSNPGRGGHSSAVNSGLKVYKARERINAFFNNVNGECIFTKNCTEALNLAIMGTARRGHVITTVTDHNSVLRPLQRLKKTMGLEVSYATPDISGRITIDKIRSLVRPDTYLVAINCCSNVTGVCNAYESIFREMSERGISTLADVSQIAGHKRVDMQELGVDMIACSGHKGLYGMQGTGFLLLSNVKRIEPLIFGGTGTDSFSLDQPSVLPESLEAGTLNTAGICALRSAVDWVDSRLEKLAEDNKRLTLALIEGLKRLNCCTIYSLSNPSGIVAFNVKGYDSDTVSDYLDRKGFAVRGGLHCAPLMHTFLGTLSTGIVRVSFGYGNTLREVDRFLSAIKSFINDKKG